MKIYGLLHVIKWLLVALIVVSAINSKPELYLFLAFPIAFEAACIMYWLQGNKDFKF